MPKKTSSKRPAPTGYMGKARSEAKNRHSYTTFNTTNRAMGRETFIADSFTYGPKPSGSKNWKANPYGDKGGTGFGYIVNNGPKPRTRKPSTRKPKRAR